MTYNNVLLLGPVQIEAHPTRLTVEQIGTNLFVLLQEVSDEGYPQKVVFNVTPETIQALEKIVETLRDNVTSPHNPPPSVN